MLISLVSASRFLSDLPALHEKPILIFSVLLISRIHLTSFFYLLHRYLLIIKGSRGLPLLLLSHLDIEVLLLLRSSFLLVRHSFFQWFLLYLIFFNYILFMLFNSDLINDFSSCERNICNLKCLWFFLLLSTEWFSPSQFFVLSKVISLLSWKDSFIRPCFRVSLKNRRLVWN